MCTFTNSSLDRIQDHIQKEHNNSKKLNVEVIFFTGFQDSSETESSNLASGEDSTTSDVAGLSTLGPIRGRPQLQIRPRPYERTEDSSSRSSSPSRKTSLGTLSPLQIPPSHAHLFAQSVPSPLNQLAYSCPNSPSPPPTDDEMNVDADGLPLDSTESAFDEEELLAKASIAIRV